MVKRPLHIVGNAQQIPGEIGGGIKRCLRLFALAAFPQIVHVRGGAQQPVLVLGSLFPEPGDLDVALVEFFHQRLFEGDVGVRLVGGVLVFGHG